MTPLLIAMAGLPGTGKSTLAAALADALPAVVLDKDKLRAGLIPPDKVEYSRAQDDYIFELLLKAAEFNLNRGRHVILDGRTFTRRYQVDRVELFAAGIQSRFQDHRMCLPGGISPVQAAGGFKNLENIQRRTAPLNSTKPLRPR